MATSGYDASKDNVILSKTMNEGVARTLTVSIVTYDGGYPKVQINRSYAGEWVKLGRLSFDEAKWLSKTIPNLISDYTALEEQIKKEITQ